MNVRNGIENVTQVLSAQTAPARSDRSIGSAAQAAGAIDTAQLSAAGTEAAQSVSPSGSISDASDIRLDKVASIRSALQSGTYHVPAADVAQKVISSLLAPEK